MPTGHASTKRPGYREIDPPCCASCRHHEHETDMGTYIRCRMSDGTLASTNEFGLCDDYDRDFGLPQSET